MHLYSLEIPWTPPHRSQAHKDMISNFLHLIGLQNRLHSSNRNESFFDLLGVLGLFCEFFGKNFFFPKKVDEYTRDFAERIELRDLWIRQNDFGDEKSLWADGISRFCLESPDWSKFTATPLSNGPEDLVGLSFVELALVSCTRSLNPENIAEFAGCGDGTGITGRTGCGIVNSSGFLSKDLNVLN